MRIVGTELVGVHLLESDPIHDDRGWYLNTFDGVTLAEAGLHATFPHQSVSFNRRRGTVRGLHLQTDPHGEVKVIRCLRGRVFDVIADVRPGSPTFGRWQGFDLAAGDGRAVHADKGLVHGYQTLVDDTELSYMLSTGYVPEAATGVRWNDAALAVDWPLPVTIISERDTTLPLLDVN